MEYQQAYYRAKYDEHTVNLVDISMVRLSQWADGRWKAAGWHMVWHSGEFSETPDKALRSLIDSITAWVDENGTRKPLPVE